MPRTPGLVAIVLLLLVCGCVQQPAPTVSPTTSLHTGTTHDAPQGKGANHSFEGSSLPSGWIAHKGNWSMKAATAPHASVLEGQGDMEPGLSSLVDHADGEYASFTAEVDFIMLSGEHPQGAGLVFDWKDEKNYQIIRYSISENGWHLFTVVNGNRNKQGDATLNGTEARDFNQWIHLKVVQHGNEVMIYDGNTRVVEYFLKEGDSHAGFVGLFCRGDTVARFDNFVVKPSD